jgi:hypothetical protein
VKGLTVALLVLGIFTPTALAQSATTIKYTSKSERHLQLPRQHRAQPGKQAMKMHGWVKTVVAAETEYLSTHGRYGGLGDLRKAHLLDALVFESDPSPDAHGIHRCESGPWDHHCPTFTCKAGLTFESADPSEDARNAQVFESDSSADVLGKAEANYVPKNTSFDLTVSSDGQHFRVVIMEECVSREYPWPFPPLREFPFEDGPEGPILAIPG